MGRRGEPSPQRLSSSFESANSAGILTEIAEHDRGEPMTSRRPPQPVLKWAGGKRQLLPQILSHLPERIDTYYEPFVGGGAVFFALAAEGRFRRAVISDQNADLICVYEAVRDDVEGVIAALSRMPHSEEAYYRVRSSRPRTLARRAARVIYLNRTGYNGLYRVNRSGQFNVPYGRYKRPRICDADNLRSVSEALNQVTVRVEDFETVVRRARRGDAVYFDPPYVPVSRSASFAAYHSVPFQLDEHRRLTRTYRRLVECGVCAVLSNSDTPETRALYSELSFDVVSARRSINSNTQGRGPVRELLVFGVAEPKPLAAAEGA